MLHIEKLEKKRPVSTHFFRKVHIGLVHAVEEGRFYLK